MKKEIKKHWGVILMLIIGVPFIFILLLKFIYAFVPGDEIGEPGDWISFAGGYLGVIGAVGAVWWQMRKEEKDEIRGLLYYIKDILEYNKNNYTLEYMEKINSQALSLKSFRENTAFEVILKDLDLSKVDKLLLYKHRYINFIKLDDKIKKAISSYNFTTKEKNIFEKIEKYIKENKEGDTILSELEIILNITLKISRIYSYSDSRKEIKEWIDNLKSINAEILKLDKKMIKDFIIHFIPNGDERITFYEKIIYSSCTDAKDIKEKYLVCLRFLYGGIAIYEENYEIIMKNVLEKKEYLFSDDYENLISEISEEYEKLEKILK